MLRILIERHQKRSGRYLRGEGVWEGGDGRAQGPALGGGRGVLLLRQGRGEIAVLLLRGSILKCSGKRGTKGK